MNEYSQANEFRDVSSMVSKLTASTDGEQALLQSIDLVPPPASPPSEETGLPRQIVGEWTYPASASAVKPAVSRPRKSSRRRKRRIYADYRQLISLESQAKKLNFLSPYTSKSPSSEVSLPSGQQREFAFPENISPENVNGFSQARANEGDSPRILSPKEQPGFLVVDQRMSMFFGSGRNLKSVVAANTAALLAWRMQAQGRQLGTIVFNDKRIVQMRPGCSRLQTLLVLQTVLNHNHSLQPNSGICSNPLILNDALRRTSKLTGTPLIFFITDASGHDGETFRVADEISQHSDLVVILIYDPRQSKVSRATTRQHLLASQLFPESVPVIPINTRNDVAYQLKHSYLKSALSSFAKARAARAADAAPLEAKRL